MQQTYLVLACRKLWQLMTQQSWAVPDADNAACCFNTPPKDHGSEM
jgi:hypothetical protein